jgi:hypothetical protein
VSLPVPRAVENLSVIRPDGKTESFSVKGRSELAYSDTSRTGFYRVTDGTSTVGEFAATLSDPSESRIEPRFVPQAQSGSAGSPDGLVSTFERSLWMVFIGAALLILLCEWIAWVVEKR